MAKQDTGYTNRLAHETSPYLLQHAHNPVNWEPWGDDAWQRAKKKDKLVIVSIGYSACHWCHVMERESFSDAAVAKWMNEHYVCIKVDREERPDIDHLYMDAAQIMTGRGGWPLNAFALPDGRPVYAGTYFPKNQWMGLLHEVAGGYRKQKEKYEEYAGKLVKGIETMNLLQPQEEALPDNILLPWYRHFEPYIDRQYGGRGNAPKFPMPVSWHTVLDVALSEDDAKAADLLKLTLDKMAAGGIYDQLGGGFARYSTDEQWKVPHFEKMLYDNAQLIELYARAAAVFEDARYKKVAEETFGFLERELLAPEGAYYCALDADSEGEEGKFYVWTDEELTAALPDEADAKLARAYFGIGGKGYWEKGYNILVEAQPLAQVATELKLTEEEAAKRLEAVKQNLLSLRENRKRPGLDNKLLLSWNALAMKALARASVWLGNPAMLHRAQSIHRFVESHLRQGGTLYHSYSAQRGASIEGFLEDYAYYTAALLALHEATGDTAAVETARQLAEKTPGRFASPTSLFYFSGESAELAVRKVETSDNVMPSPNSTMAVNLFWLGLLLGKPDMLQHSRQMVQEVAHMVTEHAAFYAEWAFAVSLHTGTGGKLAVAAGHEAAPAGRQLLNKGLRHLMVTVAGDKGGLPAHEAKTASNGETAIYLCHSRGCLAPVATAEEAVAAQKA